VYGGNDDLFAELVGLLRDDRKCRLHGQRSRSERHHLRAPVVGRASTTYDLGLEKPALRTFAIGKSGLSAARRSKVKRSKERRIVAPEGNRCVFRACRVEAAKRSCECHWLAMFTCVKGARIFERVALADLSGR
jgi:hypothetical protein